MEGWRCRGRLVTYSCSPHHDYFKCLPLSSRPLTQLSISADYLESKMKPTSMISTSFLLPSPFPPYHLHTVSIWFSTCYEPIWPLSPSSFRSLILTVWCLNQQHQHYLGSCWKCKFLPHLGPKNTETLGAGPSNLYF